MGYQALLFCADEKTAGLVTQVLTELEFSVEPANEPFAAVKRLTTQHWWTATTSRMLRCCSRARVILDPTKPHSPWPW